MERRRTHGHLIASSIACLVVLILAVVTFLHFFPPLGQRPVVAILPHQDDELFMAGYLMRAVRSGRPVYAAVVTDGGASRALAMINGRDNRGNSVFDDWLGAYHHPEAEGYEPLSREAFADIRNREFLQSAAALGIPPDHVIFMNAVDWTERGRAIFRDAKLTNIQAKRAVNMLYRRFGDGTYVTVAEGHPDHVALEQALRAALGISDKVFFPLSRKTGETVLTLTAEEKASKDAALSAYGVWSPSTTRQFAIGFHSVPDLFRQWQASAMEHYFTE